MAFNDITRSAGYNTESPKRLRPNQPLRDERAANGSAHLLIRSQSLASPREAEKLASRGERLLGEGPVDPFYRLGPFRALHLLGSKRESKYVAAGDQ